MAPRSYNILDKDLDRVSNAERAGVISQRSIARIGGAILFVAIATLIWVSFSDGSTMIWILIAGVAVAAYLAIAIGANDVANSLGPAVGAGAISMTTGLFLLAIMQVAGAVIGGADVTDRLADGIVLPVFSDHGGLSARMMIAALLAAAIWISIATWAEAPISTTHSIVGAIVGAGVATFGWHAVDWSSLLQIAAGWIISPIISGFVAAGLLAFYRATIHTKDDRVSAALIWLPWIAAASAFLFIANLLYEFLKFDLLSSTLAAIGAAVFSAFYIRHHVKQDIARSPNPREAVKAALGLPLVVATLIMGFAHGSNDAANITAPLSIILNVSNSTGLPALWPALLAGLGIACGAVLFGRKLVHMIGSKITRLNTTRAFCVTLATAATVIAASGIGLPVSTTHVAVGGVFGVGFYREWIDMRQHRNRESLPAEERQRRHLVRRSHFRTILGAWLITVPCSGLLAWLCSTLLTY